MKTSNLLDLPREKVIEVLEMLPSYADIVLYYNAWVEQLGEDSWFCIQIGSESNNKLFSITIHTPWHTHMPVGQWKQEDLADPKRKNEIVDAIHNFLHALDILMESQGLPYDE